MASDKGEHIRLGIGEATVPLHAHIAHFIESDEELAGAVGYLEEGLRGTDHCVVFGDQKANQQVCEVLLERGVDTMDLAARGRLAFISGLTTGDDMVEAFSSTFAQMLNAGATVIRLLGNIGWLEQGWPSVIDLLAMEAKVCIAARNYPCVIMCLYDLRSLPGLIVCHGALETHTFVVCGGELRENPLALHAGNSLSRLDSVSETFLELERKKEAVQLYQALFANTNDSLVIVRLDPEGAEPTVVEINPAARDISACRDVCNRTLSHCFPGVFHPDLPETCAAIAGSGGSADLGEAELCGRFFRIRLFSLYGDYLGIAFNDITELKASENALISLRTLGCQLQSTLDLENILDDLIRGAAAIVGADSGVAAICSTEEMSSCRYLVKGVPVQESWVPGHGVPGRLITHSEPYLSNDPLHDPYILAEAATRYGVRNVISTPILDLHGGMVGFLEIHNKSDGSDFTPFDQIQLASAAQTASLAVRNATAFRKISEMGARLRESTERFRHLVEGLDAIVWEADARTLQFTFVSRRAEAILGYPISRWLEDPHFWVNHIHPQDRERALETCLRATSQGKDHRIVYRAIAADGRTVWIRDHARTLSDEQGNVRQLRGIMVDITGTMAIEESLRKSEARFRSTFEGAGIGMALVDREGRPVEINPALQALLGYPPRELGTRTLALLTHPEDAESDRDRFGRLMAGSLPRYQVEKRLLGKDGREIWGRLTFSSIGTHAEGEYAICMIEDITERKRAEGEVAELLAQVQKDAAELEQRVAERTSQLEETNAELDSFAHSVSHDLRAPLRAVQGYLEILLEDPSLDQGERFQYLKRVMAAAQGMDRLIQDLLAYSRLTRRDVLLQPVSLEQVVQAAAEQLELASGGKRYEIDIARELPRVIGHQAVLVQVVLNLFTNGIKFVPAGVTPRLRVWAEPREGFCRLWVQDNGIGIPPEHQERIFKIFERLHSMESYPGTGVGLAIVRKAVLRLGGRIGVESREGEGSRFWIELPAAAPGDAGAGAAEAGS